MIPVGVVPGLGEFTWRGNSLARIVGPFGIRDATADEEGEVADALAKGQLQIVNRTPRGAGRPLVVVLHQATGRPLPESADEAVQSTGMKA